MTNNMGCKNCNYTDEYCASGECTSQSPRNGSQKGDLTEQWKKGELPSGWYYVQLKEGVYMDNVKSIIMDYYTEFRDFMKHPYLTEQVLAPVPSYEEWFKIKNLASLSECLQEKNIECLHRENKLKELLKEVLRHELSLKEVSELTRKIVQALEEDK